MAAPIVIIIMVFSSGFDGRKVSVEFAEFASGVVVGVPGGVVVLVEGEEVVDGGDGLKQEASVCIGVGGEDEQPGLSEVFVVDDHLDPVVVQPRQWTDLLHSLLLGSPLESLDGGAQEAVEDAFEGGNGEERCLFAEGKAEVVADEGDVGRLAVELQQQLLVLWPPLFMQLVLELLPFSSALLHVRHYLSRLPPSRRCGVELCFGETRESVVEDGCLLPGDCCGRVYFMKASHNLEEDVTNFRGDHGPAVHGGVDDSPHFSAFGGFLEHSFLDQVLLEQGDCLCDHSGGDLLVLVFAVFQNLDMARSYYESLLQAVWTPAQSQPLRQNARAAIAVCLAISSYKALLSYSESSTSSFLKSSLLEYYSCCLMCELYL